MDLGVFIAWIGTLLAAALCVVYGLYYSLIKKTEEQPVLPKKQEKKQEEER